MLGAKKRLSDKPLWGDREASSLQRALQKSLASGFVTKAATEPFHSSREEHALAGYALVKMGTTAAHSPLGMEWLLPLSVIMCMRP